MRSNKLLLLPAACMTALLAVTCVSAFTAQTFNQPDPTFTTISADDEVPEVTARVSRVSFIQGEAQIRRTDGTEWERVTMNLPIVEGDEITTSAGTRLEVQFNRNTYLRLDETSYLRIATLKDTGIAVSLPEGTMSVRISEFDREATFFEIDAPSTTLAVQKTGFYRIDAGKQGDEEVRVSVLEKGEARVYSNDAGFTVKSGRQATIYIAGDDLGEWNTASADRDQDEFDTWAFQRDSTIADNLKSAYYGKYYDDQMYGAEDLNSNGEWVYTKKYGYVWRPFRSAISSYSNWTPYRYGSWRWVAPYGWTWVNDEPWGYATYHFGRWYFDDGVWSWSPYGSYVNTRSWWRPALVVFTYSGFGYYWYPIPYGCPSYNYNHHYQGNNGGGHYGNNHGNNGQPNPNTPVAVPTPDPRITKPTRMPPLTGIIGPSTTRDNTIPPLVGMVPPSAVVTVDASEFGRNSKVKTAPLAAANTLLAKSQNDRQSAPQLPTYKQLNGRVDPAIKAVPPPVAVRIREAKTGATERTTDRPLDNELRNTKVFGNRPPAVKTAPSVGVDGNIPPTRQTGAVDRVPTKPVRQAPVETPRDNNTGRDEPVRQPPVNVPPPTRQRDETPKAPVRETPRYEPPTQRDTPRYTPPPVRNDPPPTQRDTPRYTPPPVRNDPPPQRERPRNDPPPTRSEPKQESKPAPPPSSVDPGGSRKKDGR